jgi:N utilization substance protein B
MLKKPALDHFSLLAENFQLNQKVVPLAKNLLAGMSYRSAEIDSAINTHADNWRLDRMSVVDRNIIRIAVYEMIFCDDIPATVSINEALEIAKKFSTDDAGPFINGILDAINKARATR